MRSNKRICIYPKDIMRITGKGEKYCRSYLEKIKDSLNKEDHQLLSVEEFCQYTGLKIEQVEPFIID